ncbi:MAG TPA: hypothetical protein VIQ00_03960 [Chitinophagaceae bacterium]|jgi:hypothetical protein
MASLFLFLPLISALAGYLISVACTALWLNTSRKRKYLNKIAKVFSSELVLSLATGKFLNSKDAYEKLVPQIEQHIDTFLNVKLVKEMPYLGMLVGDKTINSLKKIFMQELEILFPETIKSYAADLVTEKNVSKIISEKISGLPASRINSFYKKPIMLFHFWGLLLGFITGLLQLLFFFFYR